MPTIDYNNIKLDIELQLGDNSIDSSTTNINPYTGEEIQNYSVLPKDSPLYNGPVDPLSEEYALKVKANNLQLEYEEKIKKQIDDELEAGATKQEVKGQMQEFERNASSETFNLGDLLAKELIDQDAVEDKFNQYVNKFFTPQQELLRAQERLENLFKSVTKQESGEDYDYGDYADWLAERTSKRLGFSLEEHQEFKDYWKNNYSAEDKKYSIIEDVGAEIYKGEQLEEFLNADDEERERMLANTYTSSKLYKTVYEKVKEESSKHRESWNEWLSDFGLGNSFKDFKLRAIDRATHPMLYSGGDYIGATVNVVGGFPVVLGAELSEFVGGLFNTGMEFLDLKFNLDSGLALDTDSKVRQLADEFIEERAQIVEDDLKEKIDSGEETLDGIVHKWDNISREYSNIFKVKEGTHLTEIEGTEEEQQLEKLHLYAKFITRATLNGEMDAASEVEKYYKDLSHSRMTRTDYITAAAGQFGNNFVADAVSLAAIICNTPHLVIGEGYVDELMHDSWMQWANAVLETGCWTEANQKKYREAGLNKFQVYRSVEQENQFMSSADIADLIGLYGFTAATTAISMGGSQVVRFTAFAARGKFGKNTLRTAIKLGIVDKESYKARLMTKEMLAGAVARDMKWGNLGISALLGTAEGGLEATATYNNFVNENIRPFLDPETGKIPMLIKQVEQATPLLLHQYMVSNDMFPVRFRKNEEAGTFERYFTPEEYQLAKQYLLRELKTIGEDIRERIEDDALDAAAANFISNSFINGALNVTLKHSLLSRDAKESIRATRSGKPLTHYLDVVKKDGKYVAVDKEISSSLTGSSSWKLKLRHPKATVKALINDTKAEDVLNTMKGAVKTSWGEALEEYSQGISDGVSRAAFQSDLDNYMKVVFNPDARDAFTSDMGDIIGTGLNELGAQASNIENIKEGVFGFLSTLIGGVSPGRFFSAAVNNTANAYKKVKHNEEGAFKAYGKALGNTALSLWDASFITAYREQRDEKQTKEHLIDSVNTWLLDKDALALFEHMGAAIGFQAAEAQAESLNDEYGVRNSRLGLQIENILMLEALLGTDVLKAYMLSITDNANINVDELGWDDNGNYIGDNQNAANLIMQYKNSRGSNTRRTTLSDKEILLRIWKNANDFLELRDKVLSTRERILNIFVQNDENNIDPLVLNALVTAALTQEDAQKRYGNLNMKLEASIGRVRPNLGKAQGLSMQAILALMQHGSFKEIMKALKDSEATLKAFKELKMNKKSDIYLEAEYQKLYLDSVVKELSEKIVNSEDIASEENIEFTAADIAALNIDLIARVIAKSTQEGVKLNESLKKAVVSFIKEIKKDLKGEDLALLDFQLSTDEVVNDFIDLVALRDRKEAYNNYLDLYIKNPEWLSRLASAYRAEERKRSLRRIYAPLLEVKAGETYVDMLDRVNTKVQELKNQAKNEDAYILEELAKENPQYVAGEMTRKVIYNIAKMYGGDNAKVHDVIAATLMTLTINGKLNLQLLLTLFEDNNVDRIKELLVGSEKAKDMYRRELKNGGVLNLDIDNPNTLDNAINDAKKCVSLYIRLRDRKKNKELAPEKPKAKPKEKEVRDKVKDNPKTDNTNQQKENEKKTKQAEPDRLIITTAGDLDPQRDKDLFDYLRQEEASKTLQKAFEDVNGRRTKIKLRIVPFRNKFIVALMYNGKPLGVIRPENYGEALIKMVESHSKGTAVQTNAPITISIMKTPTLTSEQTVNNPEKLDLTDLELDVYVQGFSVRAEDLDNGKKRYWIEDKNGYPIEYKRDKNNPNERISIFDIEIQGKTIGERLEDVQLKSGTEREEAINELVRILREQSFFKEYFDSWNPKAPVDKNSWSMKALFGNLIGDFMHLGKDVLFVKDAINGIIYLRKDSTSSGKDDIFSFKLKDIVGDGFALERLIDIYNAVKNGTLESSNVSVSFNLINADSRFNNRRKNIFGWLVKEGYILGYNPVELKGSIEILNPFKNQGARRQQSTDTTRGNYTPNPRGVQASGGGRVDQLTGITISGTVDDIEKRALKYINNKVLAVKDIISKLMSLSEDIEEDPNVTGERYYKNKKTGELLNRVTDVKEALSESNANHYDGEPLPKNGNMTTALGNVFDGIGRELFTILNAVAETEEGKSILFCDEEDEVNVVAALVSKLEESKTFKKNGIPNLDTVHKEAIVKLMLNAYKFLTSKGWVIMPKGVRVGGKLKVKDSSGSIIGQIPDGGTLDVLAYNSLLDKFMVIDFKTLNLKSNKPEAVKQAIDLRSGDWQAQTSQYWELACLASENPNMRNKLMGLFIMPIFLNYVRDDSAVIEDDRMTIKNRRISPLDSEPKLKVQHLKGDLNAKAQSLDDIFYEMTPILEPTVDFEKLDKEQKGTIVPYVDSGVPKEAEPVTPPAPPGPMGGDAFFQAGYYEEEEDSYSSRTLELARNIDFMNSRIAPLKTFRVAIHERLMNIVKYLGNKVNIKKAIEDDLATTFFSGDIDKLKNIARVEITVKNLPIIMANIINYYQGYVSKREDFKRTIYQRRTVLLNLHKLLKGEITDEDFNNEISKLGVLTTRVVDYIEYINAEDKDKAAKEIINRIENSDIFTEENYNYKVQELEKQMQDMQMKLSFLLGTHASDMIKRRMQSVESAVKANLIEYHSYSLNGTLNNMLKNEDTEYGATSVLLEIKRKSKSVYFKILANAILETMKLLGTNIIISTVNDSGNQLFEGSFDGSVVHINISNMQSQEQLERVILHELLHAVSANSNDIKEKLSPLLELVITSILSETGQSVEEIKESTYGLRNVDEFISEFFTNSAFLELLRLVGDNDVSYNSIFDSIIGSIKSLFGRKSSLYSKISQTMELILSTANVLVQNNRLYLYKQYDSLSYSNISLRMRDYLDHLGITEEVYESLTLREKEHLKECCK